MLPWRAWKPPVHSANESALAERVLAILDEGGFSATYKFALFTAILDLCIEKTTVHGTPPETLTTRQLADKVVELYSIDRERIARALTG